MKRRRSGDLVMLSGARSRRIVGQTRQHFDVARFEFACATGKQCYQDYAKAHNAAEAMMEHGRVNPGCHQTPYECRECGYWHIFNRVVVFFDQDPPDVGNIGQG